MTIKIGVVMDPIASINYKKDTTLAMLWAAQARDWQIFYMEQKDLFLDQGVGMASMAHLTVFHDPDSWYNLEEPHTRALADLDVILMRKDPPFDNEFIYTTYILEQAERCGTLIVNKCQSLRDCNEKIFATQFPDCCPPVLVSADSVRLKAFHQLHGDVMAQRYLPEIVDGDKRILMINGEAVPYGVARIPTGDETRGNLAAGGKARPQPLSDRDHWIAEQIGPSLREKGLLFVGLDVIGDYLTEINVTSPTCIRELDDAYNLDIGGQLMNCITQVLKDRS